MMESIILAEDEDRERIVGIIEAAIEAEEIPKLKNWQPHATKKSKKSISLVGKASKKKKNEGADEELLMQMMTANRSRQADAMSSICDKYSNETNRSGGKSSSSRKASSKKSNVYEISDEDFDKAQKKMTKK